MALRIFLAQASAPFTDHLPWGDGLVASAFVRELAGRDHELHVAVDRVDLREPLPPNVHLHALGDAVDRSKALARLTFMARMRRLYEGLARRAPFDVIHQLNPVDVGLSIALAGSPVPLVLGPYVPDWAASGEGADANADMRPATLRLKRALRAVEQRRASTLLLSTAAAAAKLEAAWPRPLQVREVPPGIDVRHWHPAEGGGEDQVVLFLSNLQVRKGVFVLLDAFEHVARDLPAARLRLAGSGDQEAEVRRRVASSPHLDRIELLGPVGRERVVGVMQSCGVCCLPSFAEPFGMVALEAMACAKPVVATGAGGLGHLVDDDGGRRVPPGDPEALAGALKELLRDAGLRRAMGRHNRSKMEQRYAWPRVIDRLEQAYRDAIAARAADGPALSRRGRARARPPGRA
jgi:glycosyltransferase involved in cell wall biosynthesis